jgi:hypothetical protein
LINQHFYNQIASNVFIKKLQAMLQEARDQTKEAKVEEACWAHKCAAKFVSLLAEGA